MKLQLAKGISDVPTQEKILKNFVLTTITTTFEEFGFSPLETPVIERLETLAAKFGAGVESDALKETFKLSDQGKRKLALRFEFTTSLARYVAMNKDLKFPFKRYEFGPVFRDGPIKLGRYRQFWQCDADTIGTSSMLADAEQIAILDKVFKALDFDFTININNRKILNGILNQAGITKFKEALIAIDKLDKIGEKGVTKELAERGYSTEQADKVLGLLRSASDLETLKTKISDPEGMEGISELEKVFSYLEKLGVKSATFDVSLARGQAYYTGTVIEAFLNNSQITSSIAGGGRYDNMIAGFAGSKEKIPAVGISFGIAPIMDQLRSAGKLGAQSVAKVLVLPIKTELESLGIATQLRDARIKTDFIVDGKSMSKSLKYANTKGIPYVLIIGPKEIESKKFTLRDMQSGDESQLTIKQILKTLSP